MSKEFLIQTTLLLKAGDIVFFNSIDEVCQTTFFVQQISEGRAEGYQVCSEYDCLLDVLVVSKKLPFSWDPSFSEFDYQSYPVYMVYTSNGNIVLPKEGATTLWCSVK